MPRVTILLTCYNHLAYLDAAIEGIKAQTFQDFEVIALDDGSTDGTRERLTEIAAGLPQMRLVFNEKNLGTYGTLNVGLREAQGDFVAVLNDDDVWLPDKLNQQVAMLDAMPEVGLVHTNGRFIGAMGEPLPGTPLGFEFPRTATGNVVLALFYANKIIASAVLARKKCFDELGPFDDSFFGSGDWEMWLRIAEKYLVGYLDDELTLYRWHGDNASKKLDRIWADDEKLRERINSRAPEYAQMGFDPAMLRSAQSHNWACLGTVRKLNGRASAARKAYGESIKLCPGRFKSYLRYAATFLPRAMFRKLL